MHRYEELTPYEFELEKERASIIYISAGPLEYHEECNILGMDTNTGYDWCLAAAEITGITRQGVRDRIVKSEQIISDLEAKLGLAGRFGNVTKTVSYIVDRLTEIGQTYSVPVDDILEAAKSLDT